jgi:hypothetical protein
MTVAADPLRARGSEVALLSDILARGGFALESVPHQIKDLLRSDAWRHFVTKLGKEVRHERFAEFVTAQPLAGLGATVEMLRRVLGDDMEALDLLDRALQNPVGHPEKDSIRTNSRPTGTTKEQALRKLRKDAPELHAEVLAGNLTAHAAMVQAGYRPKTFTVRADSPESVAASLRRQLDPAALSKLVELLRED